MQNNNDEQSACRQTGRFDAVRAFPADTAVAMAYIPFQTDTDSYELTDAFSKGTLFPVLNKPFERGMSR